MTSIELMRQLRTIFPDLEFTVIRRVVEVVEIRFHGSRCSAEAERILKKVRKRTAKKRRRENGIVKRHLASIKSNVTDIHRGLRIERPGASEGLNEHLRAVLVHGFVQPGRQGKFVRKNYLPRRHVRANVERKLGRNFDQDLFDEAWGLLFRNGVILDWKKNVAGFTGYGLNSDEKHRNVTGWGKSVIAAVKQFMHSHRRPAVNGERR